MHVARSHSGTLTFQKEVDPKGEIGHRGELGRYLVQLMRWRGRVDDGRRGPENKKKSCGFMVYVWVISANTNAEPPFISKFNSSIIMKRGFVLSSSALLSIHL